MQHESSRAINARPIARFGRGRSSVIVIVVVLVIGTARTSTSIFIVAVSRCFDWDRSGRLVSQSSPLAVNCSHFPAGKVKLRALREVRDLHTLPHFFLHFATHWESYTHFPPREKVRQSYTEFVC